MLTTAGTCAVLLGAVFALSGVAKLADPRGTREAVAALLGRTAPPGPLLAVVAAVLPLVELAVALLLLPGASRRAAAVAGVAMLCAFTAVVAANLLRGRRPRCGCFGGLGSSDVSWRTVVRNLLLLSAGLLAATGRQPVTGLDVLAGAVAAGALVLAEVQLSKRAGAAQDARQSAAVEHALAQEDDAGPAPAVDLRDLSGRSVHLSELLRPGRPVLLVLLDLRCGACMRLLPSMVRWSEDYAQDVTVVAVGTGSPADVAAALGSTGQLVVLVADAEGVAAFADVGRPAVALVRPDGRLAAPLASGADAVRLLLAAALGASSPAAELELHEVDLSFRPVPRPGVTEHEVEDGVLLVDETSGSQLLLDRHGALVWQCFPGATSLQEVVADLAAVFEVPAASVAPDVLRVARTCGEHGLLQGVAAARPEPAAEPAASDAGS